jgi:hypothetical protein
MTLEEKPVAPWKVQDRLVDPEAVDQNIDRLACALAGEKREQDAWKRIFIKPPGKTWSDVVVAVKTNNIARQHTRSAVMAKICKVLTRVVGIKASNIFIYDACHGGDMLKKTPFSGLPEGCGIMEKWGGFSTDAPVGLPWKDGKQTVKAVKPIVSGQVDLLVNMALSKGHSPAFGSFSMTLKNHLGTFNPRPHAHADGASEYLMAINKSPLILGELNGAGRKVAFPRQQLCLIDALWASEQGPMCDSSDQPNRLFMGTFAPTLDYVVAHRFRKEIMGWPLNEPLVDRFLTEFGIDPTDLPNKGAVIDAMKS